MIRNEIKKLLRAAAEELQKESGAVFDLPEILVERPQDRTHGDYATNIAMVIAKFAKKNPMEIAENVKCQMPNAKTKLFEKIEVVKPGFINFFLSKEYLRNQAAEILKQGDKFGALKIGQNKKINVEFISANPTGPLTLGNGRGGFCGDVLANVLEKAGFKVVREYYINDIGEQIRKLGHSVIGDSEAVYRGDYILDLRKRIKIVESEKAGKAAAKIILKDIIKPAVKKMGIKYDVWFEESRLRKNKETEKVLDFLKKKGFAYEKEGALWFYSTKFGDDKDRVLVKEDGETAYFASDIAYLRNKFARGFEKLIFFWGADHYGYVNRIKAAAEALGYQKEKVDIVIMQLVRLFRGGKETKMSKRAGVYVTLDELIKEVGLDAARFFFLTRSADAHLNFDLDLAKEQSEKNPVYYIQYAHARVCSILRKCGKSEIRNPKSETNSKFKSNPTGSPLRAQQNSKFSLLNHPSELELIKQIIRLPEVIEDTAKDYQIQRLPQYTLDLATAFHQFYRDCRVLARVRPVPNSHGSDPCQTRTGPTRVKLARVRPVSEARLALILAAEIALRSILDIMGIKAPKKM